MSSGLLGERRERDGRKRFGGEIPDIFSLLTFYPKGKGEKESQRNFFSFSSSLGEGCYHVRRV
jgi:hypothetical protein